MISSYGVRVFKFSGAGNDFVVLDGRKGGMEPFRKADTIARLCREYRTDGLMILGEAPSVDFTMEFYNPDGSGGMMCGNGGRCIVAFADYLGLSPAEGSTWRFRAPDGLHTAQILASPEKGTFFKSSLRDPSHKWAPPSYPAEGGQRFEKSSLLWTVKLQMIDVKEFRSCPEGWFLNTGTRHLVKFVTDVNAVDMEADAKPLRWSPRFQPEGTNVNFVQRAKDGLHVRTFEKGVEGETLACGTGLTASALAAWLEEGKRPAAGTVPVEYRLQCRRGDWLSVSFLPDFTQVHLTGPAELVEIK